MFRKISALVLSVITVVSIMSGCTGSDSSSTASLNKKSTVGSTILSDNIQVMSNTTASATAPKYIFLFIGDGMSAVQVNAAQVYLGNNTSGSVEAADLNFTKFPVTGIATTYDSTSFCPDSASTATAISSGVKTHSGVIGLNVDKTKKPQSITEILKAKGMKIGIVSSVTINHATPAAFYAHVASRNDYYDIATQLANSNFDYFGGGSISQPTGSNKDKEDAYKVIESKGYYIADTKTEILNLNSANGKTYALSPVLQDSGAMPYSIDNKEGDLKLADYVEQGIEVLDNDKGFFMMCESGKIDWACHANDAMTTITEVVDFQNSIQKAVDFANKHPNETLIVVTGDHETGGLTIGYAATGYSTAFSILNKQKISYVAFDTLIGEMKKTNPSLTLNDVLPVIKTNFGLIAPSDADAKIAANKDYVMTEYEFAKLEAGFAESLKASKDRSKAMQDQLLYGTYDPLSVSLTHIINNKAGIGWTSYSHTGVPVVVYATGAGSETFGGSYDNTDIFKKLVEVTNS